MFYAWSAIRPTMLHKVRHHTLHDYGRISARYVCQNTCARVRLRECGDEASMVATGKLIGLRPCPRCFGSRP